MAAFNLSNLTDRITQVLNDNVNFSSVFGKNEKAMMELFNSLSNGETILGKVLSSSEESFQISTTNNVIINAKADSGILLTEGATILFEVNKFSEGKVSLRPLYQNTSSEETAKTALRQAGITANERSLEMTVRNMEYGNPIDRNSLLNSYKDVLAFEEAPVKYIIDLQKMNIPVTQNNLDQYEAYMNMKNFVSDSFMDISGELLSEINNKAEIGLNNDNLTISDLINNDAIIDVKGLVNSVMEYSSQGAYEGQTVSSDIALHEFDVIKLVNELKNFGFLSANTEKLIDDSIDLTNGNEIKQYNPKNVLNNVFKDINDSINRQLSDVFNKNTIINKPQYKELFDSNELKNTIFKSMLSDWNIESENEEEKTSIYSLYKKLYNNTKNISDNLALHLKNDSPVMTMLNNVKTNIEFIDSLNKYIPYIQIPIRGKTNEKAELYVYNNRKNFSDKESELSAYLHLDMEHLGRTDVMIKMFEGSVSTNFKLSDDDALEFVANNIGFLNKRLAEKGYSFKAEFEVSDKINSPIQEMLNTNENHMIIAKTSFDARI